MRSPIDTRVLRFAVALSVLAACSGEAAGDGELAVYEEERGVLFVEPESVREYTQAGNEVVFVDNRSAFNFQQSRIAGARLIPTDQMARSVGSLPLNRWIVFYCT